MFGGGGGGGSQADLGSGVVNAMSTRGTALPSAMAGATQSRGDGGSFFDAMLNSLYGVWQQRQQPQQEQAPPQAVTQPQQQPQQAFTFQTPEHLKKYFQVDAGTDPRPQYGIGGPYG